MYILKNFIKFVIKYLKVVTHNNQFYDLKSFSTISCGQNNLIIECRLGNEYK